MNVRRVIFLEKNVCAHQNNETILSRLILQILVSCESRKQYFENISSKITVWDHLLNLKGGGYVFEKKFCPGHGKIFGKHFMA